MKITKAGVKYLSPTKSGHALDHVRLHGGELVAMLNGKIHGVKTAFRKKEDAYEAGAIALNSEEGRQQLKAACDKPGTRVRWETDIPIVDIQCAFSGELGKPGYLQANKSLLTKAGIGSLRVHVELEVRERNGVLYPHFQTLYPVLGKQGVLELLNYVQNNPDTVRTEKIEIGEHEESKLQSSDE